jgi:hypothetical protein
MLEQRMSTDMCTCGELRKAAGAVTMLYDNAVEWAAIYPVWLTTSYIQE